MKRQKPAHSYDAPMCKLCGRRHEQGDKTHGGLFKEEVRQGERASSGARRPSAPQGLPAQDRGPAAPSPDGEQTVTIKQDSYYPVNEADSDTVYMQVCTCGQICPIHGKQPKTVTRNAAERNARNAARQRAYRERRKARTDGKDSLL